MNTINDLALIGLGLLLLFAGAESLVRGSTSLALRAGLSRLLAGLTIVAFGTSAPELVVSIEAALTGRGDISVGNVVGSNSFNVAVILGVVALVCPIPVHRQVIRIDAPIALGIALILPVLLLDQRIGRPEGMILVAGLVAYIVMNFIFARRQQDGAGDGAGDGAEAGDDDAGIPGVSGHWGLDLGFIVLGLGVLILGSRVLVTNAVSLAQTLGVSEAVIGLTIIAAGTSTPELATSLVAALRRQPDIAIGNVIGSNIFNLMGILGVASLVTPLTAPGISTLDVVAMIVFSALLLPFLYTGRLLQRMEGVVLLVLYGIYLFLLWPAN